MSSNSPLLISLNQLFSWKSPLLFLLIISPLFLPQYSFCLESGTNQEITDFRNKLRRIQKGINTQESDIQRSENEARSLLLELEILDKQLAEQQLKLEEFEKRILLQHALIEEKTSKLNTIHSEKSFAADHLGKRIKAFYTMGEIGLLNVTFSSTAFPELLRFHDAFEEMIKYDQNIFEVYRKTINDLERVKRALSLEEAVLQDFKDQVVKEKQEIISTTNEKKNLLLHIRTQTKLHKQAKVEMQQTSDALSSALVALKNKTNAQEYRFSDNMGSLPPPVDGVIVTLFQQENTNKLGISRKSSGITLEAPDGTKIKAVSEGSVVFSGYLRGYGNTVIIHHGYQYYSVTSRIEKLLVRQGDTVKPESLIGIMGDAATLFDGGLYFEIRHGKKPLDPILWLNPNRLSTPQERSN